MVSQVATVRLHLYSGISKQGGSSWAYRAFLWDFAHFQDGDSSDTHVLPSLGSEVEDLAVYRTFVHTICYYPCRVSYST